MTSANKDLREVIAERQTAERRQAVRNFLAVAFVISVGAGLIVLTVCAAVFYFNSFGV